MSDKNTFNNALPHWAETTTFIAVSNEIKNIIYQLLSESSQLNSNDVLVHADEDNKKLIFSPTQLVFKTSDFPKTILRETEKTKKESGVNSLCIASGLVELKVGDKIVSTPVYLVPVAITKNKIKDTISLNELEEDGFLNPFLASFLEGEIDLETTLDFDTTISKAEVYFDALRKLDLSVKDVSIIGNFHHHRYEIIKELQELYDLEKCSDNLIELLGEGSNKSLESLHLSKDLLFAADVDHEAVFENLNTKNTVIQGPPGTGKSQVLSNILGKNLKANKTTIVVSEKRVALEVLKKKLAAFGLDKLCFIATSDKLSHSFLQELKSTWDYFETYDLKPVNNLRLSEQYLANIQMTLDLLSQKELIGGVSFDTFKKRASNKNIEQFSYSSNAPRIDHFIEIEKSISEVYKSNLNAALGSLKKHTLEADDFIQFDSKIDTWISALIKLKNDFEFSTWSDFISLMKEAADCQIYENDLFKKYADIFRPNSKPRQSFIRLRKNYLKVKAEVDQISSNQSHWKIVPSESETHVLKNTLSSGTFFAKLHSKKRWKKISNLGVQNAIEALDIHLKEIDKINSFTQIIIKFCELGVEDPENEIPLIHQGFGFYSEGKWENIQAIGSKKRAKITASHKVLETLHQDLKAHLNLSPEEDLLLTLEHLKNSLAGIISKREVLKSFDENVLIALSNNSTFEDFEGQVLNSHWSRFKERFPGYANFEMKSISDKVNNVISSLDSESKLLAQEIENNIAKRYSEFHEILNTPARKLSEEQKVFKARLKRGKSILVKEFSKTRSHPSLRELFYSEAREWIQLLKPVWFSNPSQISKCFPCEEGLFDLAIFDEASQIPVQNGLGTVHRSKRIIVAGDEHQMGPSSYFKSGDSETMDLLHKANYYWSKVNLKHHYRSENPELISFSNKHFYDGELKAFPSYNSSKAIHHYLITDGQFIDRKNTTEAKAIAKTIEGFIDSKESIGIVAFSEEQLNCIWAELKPAVQQKLSDKLENNMGFFKSLENVQGDECDHLFISFGYGKNEDGEFHMRFGPMNTINGRRRLNVLLTRAIKSIHFHCSVASTDFKLSDNESINLLRQWIAHSESYSPNKTLQLPFEIQTEVSGNTITLSRIQESLSGAQELVTLQSVLSDRGWDVVYD